jgi:hypothetical protein
MNGWRNKMKEEKHSVSELINRHNKFIEQQDSQRFFNTQKSQELNNREKLNNPKIGEIE